VSIGGESIGRLDGFRFVPDPRAVGLQGRTLRAAALKGLESEIAARSQALVAAEDSAVTLSEHGKLWWDGAIVARLVAGPSPLAPNIEMLADAHVRADALRARLETWIATRVAARLGPLLALRDAADAKTGSASALPGEARGIAHQLAENFASLDRATVTLPEKLGPLLRALRPFGVWFGRRRIYLPKLLRPDAAGLLTLLWGVWAKKDAPPAPPAPGLTSFAVDKGSDTSVLQPAGFVVMGGRAIRLDMLERLEDALEKALSSGMDAETLLGSIVSLLGASKDEARAVLEALGWREVAVADAKPVWRRSQEKVRRPQRDKPRKPEPPPDPHSPFARLAALKMR
jgi:ATP-dependent RNA helicase SUPV3L1/SUV3